MTKSLIFLVDHSHSIHVVYGIDFHTQVHSLCIKMAGGILQEIGKAGKLQKLNHQNFTQDYIFELLSCCV